MIYKGSCHCGAVKFEVETDLKVIKQCNCSICKRKYAKMGIEEKSKLKIIDGENNLNIYKFGTEVAEHYFCKICGIYTHHGTRSRPNYLGVNIGCLENIDPFEFESEIIDNK